MIYLDWAATAPPAQEALDAMLACAREAWQNPSAAYSAAILSGIMIFIK